MVPSIAFLFPGQGRVPEAAPPPSEQLDRLFALAEARGLPLRDWIRDRQEDLLARTVHAQPALLIDSLAREASLRTAGWSADVVAGHSLGEYAALVSAGVLDDLDALGAVIERGRAMDGIDGAMAAILKLDLGTVESLCDKAEGDVCVANHNAASQIVVSGDATAVSEVARKATDRGGRAIPLRVSGPFHSPAMRPAEQALEPLLRSLPFRPPGLSFVSSVTGTIQTDPAQLRDTLCRQITARVRWVDVVSRLEELGVETAVEVGSGDVLTRLGRRSSTRIRFVTYKEAFDERA